MRIQFFLLSVALAWIAWPASLAAQEAFEVREGDLVRLSSTQFGETLFVGEVVGRSADTLTVNYWQPTVRKWEMLHLPVNSINSLEVKRGTRTQAGKGALLGGLIGSGFGLAAGIAAASYDCSSGPWGWDACWYWGQGEMIPASTITFGLLGAGVGALIGTLSRSDIWEPIPPGRLQVRISPTSDGVALSFTLGI